MDRTSILHVFRNFYGSGVWASKKLSVPKSTISEWLHGARDHKRLEAAMPKLAADLVRTGGACVGRKVNGVSARAKVSRIRGRKGKK